MDETYSQPQDWPSIVSRADGTSNRISVQSDDFSDIGKYHFQVHGVSNYGHALDFNFTLVVLDGCRSADLSLEYESQLEALVGRKATLPLFEASLEYEHCDYVRFKAKMVRCDGLTRAIDCSSFITVQDREITANTDGLGQVGQYALFIKISSTENVQEEVIEILFTLKEGCKDQQLFMGYVPIAVDYALDEPMLVQQLTITPEFSYCVPVEIRIKIECSLGADVVDCPLDLIQIDQEKQQLQI